MTKGNEEKLDELLNKIKKYKFTKLKQYHPTEPVEYVPGTPIKSITRTNKSDKENYIVVKDEDGYVFHLYIHEIKKYTFKKNSMIIYEDEKDVIGLY